jgi:hypothetical protein
MSPSGGRQLGRLMLHCRCHEEENRTIRTISSRLLRPLIPLLEMRFQPSKGRSQSNLLNIICLSLVALEAQSYEWDPQKAPKNLKLPFDKQDEAWFCILRVHIHNTKNMATSSNIWLKQCYILIEHFLLCPRSALFFWLPPQDPRST